MARCSPNRPLPLRSSAGLCCTLAHTDTDRDLEITVAPAMATALRAVAIALAAVCLPSSTGQRTTVPLDLGWRFAHAPQPPCSYPTLVPGYIQGTGWMVPNVTTSAACEAAACAENTLAWSFCDGHNGASTNTSNASTTPATATKPNSCARAPGLGGNPPYCIVGSTGQLFLEEPWASAWVSRARDTSHGQCPFVTRRVLDCGSGWHRMLAQ